MVCHLHNEIGRGLPDASIMIDLCNILGISVNDLLSGEMVNKEQYDNKVDENLIKLHKQKENIIISIKWNYVVTIIIFLIWNTINVSKYGINSAISMDEFYVMNLIIFIYFIIYVCLLKKQNN